MCIHKHTVTNHRHADVSVYYVLFNSVSIEERSGAVGTENRIIWGRPRCIIQLGFLAKDWTKWEEKKD